MFATHGLVPGELDGLTQPALALSAPNVADVDGDGLLTMEEILALKLDADWVVLSACNTGSAAAAGAEAASGLGPRVLLRRHARDPGHQLVSALGLGARACQRPVPPPERRSQAHARRSAAPGHDGAARQRRLQGRVGQDAVQLRPPAVLGALYDHRRRGARELSAGWSAPDNRSAMISRTAGLDRAIGEAAGRRGGQRFGEQRVDRHRLATELLRPNELCDLPAGSQPHRGRRACLVEQLERPDSVGVHQDRERGVVGGRRIVR